MKVSRLKFEFDYDFQVFALISTARDYKLAWNLNKILNLHLCKGPDICIHFPHESKIYITNFIFEKEYSSFRLLKNKACDFHNINKPYLLPELKDYDYIIVLKDEAGELDADLIHESLKGIPLIEYIIRIEADSLKSKENLIFN